MISYHRLLAYHRKFATMKSYLVEFSISLNKTIALVPAYPVQTIKYLIIILKCRSKGAYEHANLCTYAPFDLHDRISNNENELIQLLT